MPAAGSRGFRRLVAVSVVALAVSVAAACSSSGAPAAPSSPQGSSRTPGIPAPTSPRTPADPATASDSATARVAHASSTASRPTGEFTVNLAGDVHFAGRVGRRLAADPATVFAQAQPGLADADLTMVNLETAITNGHGTPQAKEFTFRAPPSALTALRDAGVDVATMANNHGADYGEGGLSDTLAAIRASRFPVVGIGANAAAAFAPYTTTLNGARFAIISADQVQDETTLRLFSAGPHTPGVANAFSPRLVQAVRAAKAAGYVVLVYIHWGVEYTTCPSDLQRTLADTLARAGAAAVVGTHAHVLQGAGWRPDGTFVAYGLGNYLWWQSFGNDQDDNGVLTLTFRHGRVVSDRFTASHLDDRGVPLPATGAQRKRIDDEWDADRGCADLAAHPPR